MTNNSNNVIRISKESFEALFHTRTSLGFSQYKNQEVEWFSTKDKSLIATIVQDKVDHDFGFSILGRDLDNLFRCIKVEVSFKTKSQARKILVYKMNNINNTKTYIFPQGDKKNRKPFNIYKKITCRSDLHPYFILLIEDPKYLHSACLFRLFFN